MRKRSRKSKLTIKGRAVGEFKSRNKGRSKLHPNFKTAASKRRRKY